MIKLNKFLPVFLFCLINLNLFAPLIITPTNNVTDGQEPANPVPTDYKEPAPRNIVVLFDNGQENPYNELYGPGSIQSFLNNLFGEKNYEDPVIINQFISAISSNPAPAIFVSESIMNSLIARQTIVNDFLTLSDDALTKKYEGMTKFKDAVMRAEFKFCCKTILENFNSIKTSLNNYTENPSPENLELFGKANQLATNTITSLKQTIATISFNGNTTESLEFIKDILFNYLPSYNALDLNKWAIGKTNEGSYFLLPKDETGTIIPTGFNYKNLDGFNTITVENPFDRFNANPKTAISNPNTDLSMSLDALLKIIEFNPLTTKNGLPFDNSDYAKLNMHIIGHGSGSTQLLEGSRAGISLTDFNKKLIPALEKSFTQTLSDETCYGGDINKAESYKAEDGSTGIHSFTAISGISSLTPLTLFQSHFINQATNIYQEEKALIKNGKQPNSENLENLTITLISNRNFGTYFNKIATSTAEAVSNFFKRDNESIEGLTGIPSIKTAGSDHWFTADYVRDNILQISDQSNIKDRARAAYENPFIYNFPEGGGLLTSKETIVTPIKIEGNYLPFITPLSIGQKIHYLKEVIIDDPSISIKEFIAQSIKPFIDQMNEIELIPLIDKNIAEKTIIIDSLHTKEGIITLVVTKDRALYTIKEEPKGLFGQQPLHSISLTDSYFSWTFASSFKSLLKKGRDNATLEMLEVEKLQGISTTIQNRQKSLLLLQKLTANVDWALYTRTHDLSNKQIIYNAIIEIIKNNDNNPLNGDFLLDFSSEELIILADVIGKNLNTALSFKQRNAIKDTLNEIKQELSRQELVKNLQEKAAIDSDATLDWYMTLPIDQQILIKYEFNAEFESGTILSQDPDTLSNKERTFLKSYIQETINISSSATQIAELNKKLEKINSPRNEEKFNQYLKDKLASLNSLDQRETLIDWVASLGQEEKKVIAIDIEVIFLQEIFNNLYEQITEKDNLNVNELFELKINLNDFLLSSDNQKELILKKLTLTNFNAPISSPLAQITISESLKEIDDLIFNKFIKITQEEEIGLLSKNSIDDYAKIFKELPFEMQTMIAKNLALLKDVITTDLLNYQKSLLPERIATAATPDDLDAIQADLTAAMNLSHLNYSPTDMPADFQITYDKLLTAQNKRIAEHAPAIPSAGSTGPLNFDPTILNQQTGQPLANTNQDNPTNPINPENTPGQVIQDKNPDFQDKELEDEWKKEHEQEILEEKQAKSAETANEEASKNNNPERIIE